MVFSPRDVSTLVPILAVIIKIRDDGSDQFQEYLGCFKNVIAFHFLFLLKHMQNHQR